MQRFDQVVSPSMRASAPIFRWNFRAVIEDYVQDQWPLNTLCSSTRVCGHVSLWVFFVSRVTVGSLLVLLSEFASQFRLCPPQTWPRHTQQLRIHFLFTFFLLRCFFYSIFHSSRILSSILRTRLANTDCMPLLVESFESIRINKRLQDMEKRSQCKVVTLESAFYVVIFLGSLRRGISNILEHYRTQFSVEP